MIEEMMNKLKRNPHCKICFCAENLNEISAKEMLNGTRQVFKYFECPKCGCVQLSEIPEDLSIFYGKKYYSFRFEGLAKSYLRMKWAQYSYKKDGFNVLGLLLFLLKGDYKDISYLSRLKINKDDKILDVGCGMAHSLICLGELGFKNLTGVDPFIEASWSNKNVRVLKTNLSNLKDSFDLIVSNWSFEHMDDHYDVISNFDRLLGKDGTLLLRIPIVSSEAWRMYGVNWYNMDPPRHLFLHTYRSLDLLLKKNDLCVEQIYYESDWTTLYLSHCYKKDLSPSDRGFQSFASRIFIKITKYFHFKRLSSQINRNGQSDLVCFVVKKNNKII
jgi:SAM-dependent methyltransferase